MPHAIQIRQTGDPEVLKGPCPRLQAHDPLYETGFRSGSFPYLRRGETAGGLRFCRQGYFPALARLSKTARIDGHVRTSLRSRRSHCVNQRFALKGAADAHKALEARATSGSTMLTI
jgi:hypothetical protein